MRLTYEQINEILSPFEATHSEAAMREGWCLSNAWGSSDDQIQVQRLDNPEDVLAAYGFLPPLHDGDSVAWAIVGAGTGPHHIAAREILQKFSPGEYLAVMSGRT